MGAAVVVDSWLGRALTAADLEVMRGAVHMTDARIRAEIARRLCEA